MYNDTCIWVINRPRLLKIISDKFYVNILLSCNIKYQSSECYFMHVSENCKN